MKANIPPPTPPTPRSTPTSSRVTFYMFHIFCGETGNFRKHTRDVLNFLDDSDLLASPIRRGSFFVFPTTYPKVENFQRFSKSCYNVNNSSIGVFNGHCLCYVADRNQKELIRCQMSTTSTHSRRVAVIRETKIVVVCDRF